mmetsp:Transcript_58647/g.191235  ORF Transcript_58647/g.191235 Transcript_58647/m.191235 type:complete len:250 (+) Transcript_58647:413-1162(+)
MSLSKVHHETWLPSAFCFAPLPRTLRSSSAAEEMQLGQPRRYSTPPGAGRSAFPPASRVAASPRWAAAVVACHLVRLQVPSTVSSRRSTERLTIQRWQPPLGLWLPAKPRRAPRRLGPREATTASSYPPMPGQALVGQCHLLARPPLLLLHPRCRRAWAQAPGVRPPRPHAPQCSAQCRTTAEVRQRRWPGPRPSPSRAAMSLGATGRPLRPPPRIRKICWRQRCRRAPEVWARAPPARPESTVQQRCH